MQDPTARPSLGVKIAYGIGSVAYGVKDNGFDYFLLFFFSQVLGLDAQLVGLALLLALLADALSDPVVGYLSDNARTRFGRRHPFMYAAILPVTLSYMMLWSPPEGWSDGAMFLYILGFAVVIRTFITLYEVPCSSLLPELTADYDQRTSFLSYRFFFGWFGGAAMSAATLAVILHPTETISNGMMNAAAYADYGVAAALVMASSMLICSLGTHHMIPHLKAPPARERKSVGRIFREIAETLADPSFFALLGAALFGAMASGAFAGLTYYINSYYWEFSPQQIAQLSLSVLISAIIALAAAPTVSRLLGKKQGALLVGALSMIIIPAPVVLRLMGLLPENGDPDLFAIILASFVVGVAMIIILQIITTSMLADLVEQSELRTKRRSEGVFFAAITFTRKSVQGLGLMTASVILSLAEFPTGAAPGEVPEDRVLAMGAYFAPTIFVIYLIALCWILFYRIDRNAHAENLRKLAER